MSDPWTYEQREFEAQERFERREREAAAAVQQEMANLVGNDRKWPWFSEFDLEVARTAATLWRDKWKPEDFTLMVAREACARADREGYAASYRAGVYDFRPEVEIARAAIAKAAAPAEESGSQPEGEGDA